VLASWGPEALAEAGRRLGYRLRLVQSTTPTEVRGGERVPFTVSIANDGYAAPFRGRAMQLVLMSDRSTIRIPLPVNIQDLTPGTTITRTTWVTVPDTAGTYELYLAFPDPAPSLANMPAYSIRLANPGLWSGRTGWNALRQQLRVTY
jgi:hypothetical protein